MPRFFRRLRSPRVRQLAHEIYRTARLLWWHLTCPSVTLKYSYESMPAYISIDGSGQPYRDGWTTILRADPCVYCGTYFQGITGATVDHITPKSAGGTDHWINLSGACKTCNSQKGSMSLLMFLVQRDTARRNALKSRALHASILERSAANKARCAANAAWVQSLRVE